MKKNGHSSLIIQFLSPITHHSITHFLSPNNKKISHSTHLAPNTQLCFQHKKQKKNRDPYTLTSPMHLNPVPGPINSIHPKYLILPNCISSPFRIARSSLTPSMASAQASPTCANTADNVATFFLPPTH